MNVNTAANILLIAAAVVWILARQVKASPVKPRLLVLAPLVMGYFGIKDTPVSTWKSGADLGFILVGAIFSIGLGLWRGNTIRVWRETDGSWWRAGTKTTLYLWGALLLVRGALAGVADATSHKAADGLGPILFSLALSFAAQNIVIGMHMSGSGSGAPAVGGPVNGAVRGAGPVDLGQYNGQYNGQNLGQNNAQPGQYGQQPGQPGQYGNQGGHGQPADYQQQQSQSQPSDYGQAPGYAQQQGQNYPPSAGPGFSLNGRHERIQQRRADRRARRSDRRGY